MKNLMINAFGDLVERTDYGNHKNQLNLFDNLNEIVEENRTCLLYTSPSPRDLSTSRMPSSA